MANKQEHQELTLGDLADKVKTVNIKDIKVSTIANLFKPLPILCLRWFILGGLLWFYPLLGKFLFKGIAEQISGGLSSLSTIFAMIIVWTLTKPKSECGKVYHIVVNILLAPIVGLTTFGLLANTFGLF